MRTSFKVLVTLFCGFLLPGFSAQGKSPAQVVPPGERPPASAPPVDRRILLDVVVTDRSGKIVPGLQQQDFTILDNKRPQTSLSFREARETTEPADPPLQSIVLVDAVNTDPEAAGYQRVQLEKFLRHGGGELPLPMSVIPLTDKSGNQGPVSQDGNVVAGSLNSQPGGVRIIGRSQGYYGGVDRVQICLGALERLLSYEATQPGRKLVIWLGPGWPTLSGPNVQLSAKNQDALFQSVVKLCTAMRQARVTIYDIDPPVMSGGLGRAFYYESFLKGVRSANDLSIGNLALQVLAVQSGGRVLNSSNDIPSSITTCLEDAKVFYTLSFDSLAADRANEYHNLQVKIDKPGLTGRTRTGYYAQP